MCSKPVIRSVALLFIANIFATTLASCPPYSEVVYSPFVPVSQKTYFQLTNATNNGCWWWAGCAFSEADEPRKQQFAAVALIMGLIPLTIKDIAWPERRLIDVSRRLPVWVDVFVRSMGIVPNPTNRKSLGQSRKAFASGPTYRWAIQQTRTKLSLCIAAAAAALAVGYTALALMETFSKRSALGCPYPVFILTWHLAAIVPAIIMTWLGKSETAAMSPEIGSPQLDVAPLEEPSPVPGQGMNWAIQLSFAIYYIAGTLVYTSIMAVTVIELFVWVIVSIEVAAASKALAFFVCIIYEDGEA
ncbi:hypothetical protein EV356DRAFT_455175 [Viridothelium virens]|uniref:Uncharacterized protein n=1 Tax=Viridothelium virens TaxID=1048519 RepID=A0A6A6GW99_VIRVR|nr:hypothetical protein EV356DRAFT_455175 [Viridothelium virens]